jgi:hypothetical protein
LSDQFRGGYLVVVDEPGANDSLSSAKERGMFDVYSDLMKLFSDHRVEVCDVYKRCTSAVLNDKLAYSTPAMYGLATTLFSSNQMVAYNLLQNSIDEAKGAARVALIAERYAPPALKDKMLSHVADEMKHSRQFLNLIELTGLEADEEPTEKSEKEVAKVLDFDDDLRQFICRVHSIEVRSWTMLRIYKSVIERTGTPRLKEALPVLDNIMADEINHVLYTGDTLSRWVDEDQKHMSGVMSECFSHTNKETWHDMAFMLNYLSENYSTAL